MERRWRVLIVVSIAVFMATLDVFIVNIAFPSIHSDLRGSSIAGLSWVLNAYAIVFAALLVPSGRLADRFGRRRGFLVGMLIFVTGSALCGAAPSVATLVAARVVQATGAAILLPTSLALVLPEFVAEERAAAIGVWAAAGGVAAAAGPPLGGLLVEATWRLVFLVNVPIGLAAALYAARILVESRDESQRRLPDLLGTAVLTIAIGALALGLIKAPDWGWFAPRTVGCWAAAVVGVAIFWLRCERHPSPVIDLTMLRVRSYAMANAAALLFAAAFGAMLLGNVLFLTGVWRESALTAGLSLAPGPVMAAFVSVPAGKLADRVGQRYLASLGCLLFGGACLWWVLRATTHVDFTGTLLPGMLVGGAGVGLTFPTLASAAAASLPQARFATGSAVLTMARQIGAVLGVSVVVGVIGTPNPLHPMTAFDDAWRVMIIPSIAGALAAIWIGRVEPVEALEQAAEPELAAAATEPQTA
jgi:EmrB/QacA subfamily drug resistance transporter